MIVAAAGAYERVNSIPTYHESTAAELPYSIACTTMTLQRSSSRIGDSASAPPTFPHLEAVLPDGTTHRRGAKYMTFQSLDQHMVYKVDFAVRVGSSITLPQSIRSTHTVPFSLGPENRRFAGEG